MPFLVEEEVGWARRGWPDSQRLLAGEPIRRLPGLVPISWYDTRTSPERGAFALVRAGGPHEELVGDILRISRGVHSAFVYVLESADLPTDIAVARTVMVRLALLARSSVNFVVEVV